MLRDPIFQSACFDLGVQANLTLPSGDVAPFLESMWRQRWRARTQEHAKALCIEYLERYRRALQLWQGHSWRFDEENWGVHEQAKAAFMENAVDRRFHSPAEMAIWAERWIHNYHREHNTKPATIAQRYLHRDWWATGGHLTSAEVLALLDASGTVEPWSYDTFEQNGVTYTDLQPLKSGAILKCPSQLMDIVKRFPPFTLKAGKLSRPTASGGEVACHQLIVPFLYQEKGESLPAWTLKTQALNGDWLDWRPENLIIQAVSGVGTQPDETGESRNAKSFRKIQSSLTGYENVADQYRPQHSTSEPSESKADPTAARKEDFDHFNNWELQHLYDPELRQEIADAAARVVADSSRKGDR